MKTLKSIRNLKNKKVLVRVDFNVPVGGDGIVDSKEDWRIKAVLPTIKYLIEEEAKIILIAHLGRPNVVVDSRLRGNDKMYSLKPVADRLGELLNREIKFVDDCVGDKVKNAVEKTQAGEIVLLENLRFYEGEENNDEKFARELAELADIYVNNAFSVSHRKHASVCAITKFLPSYAGLLLEKEVNILSKVMKNPKKPAVAIIGGAKVNTKLPVIENLTNKFDFILVGGKVANEILNGDKKMLKKNPKVKLPKDFIWINNKNNRLDIGPETVKKYEKIISMAKTIIWNGPMGMFEKEEFSYGTKNITKSLTKNKAYVIIGGGETIAAADKFGDLEKIDYVCTGGGAMLEFLSGNQLPGLEALE
ncbi:phosphoglycerate kinase [Patescibacteria group bacterium]|nr:phosphoglycerate kinase [Patescibacteria group bacterium]